MRAPNADVHGNSAPTKPPKLPLWRIASYLTGASIGIAGCIAPAFAEDQPTLSLPATVITASAPGSGSDVATTAEPAVSSLEFPGVAMAAATAFPRDSGSTATPDTKRFAIFAQSTFTAMNAFGFKAPYQGAQSLKGHDLRETWDATAFMGVRPWAGAELWANPEVDEGFGISNTLGLAGYASGEAYKLGQAAPYFRVQRLFLRQTFNFGGKASKVEAAPNQMAGEQSDTRLVLTLGRLSVADVFDTNKYAHDPRADFLNWSVIGSGAFDYAANPWGFSNGGAAEFYTGPWTARVGLFAMSRDPNGIKLQSDLSQRQVVAELEHRHTIGSKPGSLRVAVWNTNARLARYQDAIAQGLANGTTPDQALVRRQQSRWGGYVNLDQQLTGNLGAFLRASTSDGQFSAFDFTDIDTSFSGGLSLSGKGWHRTDDTVGVGFAANQISKQAQAYFAAGGLGILIGDGQLPHPGTEAILESYYAWRPIKPLAITFDYQFVANPAYNTDRGPVSIFGVRLHASF